MNKCVFVLGILIELTFSKLDVFLFNIFKSYFIIGTLFLVNRVISYANTYFRTCFRFTHNTN